MTDFTDVPSIAPVLRETADRADRVGRLSEEAVDAMVASGLFRAAVPRSVGGLEMGLPTAVATFAEVGAANTSAGWVLANNYVAQRLAGTFGDEVRQEVWAGTPDVPICLARNGVKATADVVRDGVRISGQWPWASGCHSARWAALGVSLPDNAGPGIVLVPMTDLKIDATWDMLGMRGTGSDTLVADNIVIPSRRVRSAPEIANADVAEPLYRVPDGAMPVVIAGALLGAARDIQAQTMRAVASGKRLTMSFYSGLAAAPSVQAALADAATMIDAAELHLTRSARETYNAAEAGDQPTFIQRTRLRMDTGQAISHLLDASQLLMTVNGASAFANTSPLQRPWRDLQTGARHAAFNPGLGRELYGRALAGITDLIGPV